MIITCCKDCTERYVGCHGKCETYIQQDKERKAYNTMIFNAKNPDIEYGRGKAKIIEKTRRRHGRR